MDLKWIEPESRWLMRTLFKRNLDAFTDNARRTINWAVLAGDLLAVYLVLSLL